MTDAIQKQDTAIAERVMIEGDLSKLTPQERVNYYGALCKSVGINPLSRPFEYIKLSGKLVLYARKDATEQLRSINGVSIDDIKIEETQSDFIVTVSGHDKTGRRDADVGVVSKKDMQGNQANARMKAVTKAKRRFTLSICGLGFLDETEVETIPDAEPVVVDDSTGEIVEEDKKKDEPVNPDRPYPPVVFAEKFAGLMANFNQSWTEKAYEPPFSDDYQNMIAAWLNKVFDKDEEKRHRFLAGLTGSDGSVKSLTVVEAYSLRKVMGIGVWDWNAEATEVSAKEIRKFEDWILGQEMES